MNVGNLISGSSAFSTSSLYIWKFLFQVLLKPSLKNFEHYIAIKWNECNCAVVWAFFGIALLWDWNENWPFPVLGHCWIFQICLHMECKSTFTASSFRIWNSSTGIPSPPSALYVVILPKTHLTSHSRMFGYRWMTTPSWFIGVIKNFFVKFFCVFLPLSIWLLKSMIHLEFILMYGIRYGVNFIFSLMTVQFQYHLLKKPIFALVIWHIHLSYSTVLYVCVCGQLFSCVWFSVAP